MPVLETISPSRWSLAGSVTTPLQVLQSSHSLKLIRRFDALSSQIRSAMHAKSILPVVEINTPNSMLTLTNAKVVNIVPHVSHAKPEGLKGAGTNELLEFDITFARIVVSHKISKKANTDNWAAGG